MNDMKRTSADTQDETRENTMIGSNKQKSPFRFAGACRSAAPLHKGGREHSLISHKGGGGHSLISPFIKGGLRGIFSATCLALFLIPLPALADNECMPIGVDPSLNGALADSYECDGTSYGDGVTYTADGDLVIDFTASPTTEVEAGGIDLSATGSDDITFDSQSTATEIESRSTVGPLLDVQTSNGDIDIQTEEMDADGQTPTNVTHAIRAMSGSGDISINTSGSVDAASGSNPSDSIGIEARSNSGDIDLTTMGTVAGNQYGIQAETGGSGNLTITAVGAVNVDDTDGIAAIDATTGTGLLTVNVASGSGSVNGNDSGTAIRADAGGDAVINIASGRTVNAGDTALDLTAAGDITVNNAGSIVAQTRDSMTIRASGNSLTLNNDGTIRTRMIDFSGLESGYIFNNNAGARWQFTAGPSPFDGVSELGAGVFNNAGTIELGIREVVLATGTTFTGTGNSTLEIQAALNVAGQSSCLAPATASCLDLTGGSTSGQTQVLIDKTDPNGLDPKSGLTQAANSGVLLVDVSGGTSHAGDFVLHPDSEDYAEDPKYGAVLDTGGLLDYALLYNPDTQEHVLTSVPQKEGIEYVSFIQESLSIWHTTSDAVAGRQADLRGGAVGGGWARIISEQTERESVPTLTTHGNTFTYDQDYTLDTWSTIGGYDLTSSDNYVIGLHAGFVYSKLQYDDGSDTWDKAKGATMGAYAGWWNEAGLTLDGTLNTNFLRLQHKVSMDLERSVSDVRSIGLRGEAGWLVPLAGDAFYVQPLATAAYVHTNIETLELRQNKLRFKDAESQRAALGLRLGGETELNHERFGKLNYWLTARAWEEYAEDGNVQFLTEGEPLAIEDDISGSFQEVNAGVSASNQEGNLTGFLSAGLKSGNDTDTYNFTVGARLRW